ncbi:MAG: D-glycero-alpha-D-manno-heptose-1,7-bisphosphate 7-phosphatase [Planctomycetota bacterium]
MKKTVFLDRDGTINYDSGYISDPDELILLENAAEAIKLLMPYYNIIVISNQSGVSRGFYTHEDVKKVNDRLSELLKDTGAEIDGIYYCPHQKSDNCSCRKPKPGMFLQAAKDHMLNLEYCWMVGDRSTDIEAGLAIAARTILLPEPHDAPPLIVNPKFTCKSLLEAAEIILKADRIS